MATRPAAEGDGDAMDMAAVQRLVANVGGALDGLRASLLDLPHRGAAGFGHVQAAWAQLVRVVETVPELILAAWQTIAPWLLQAYTPLVAIGVVVLIGLVWALR